MLTHPSDELRLSKEKVVAICRSDATGLDWNSGYDHKYYNSPAVELFINAVSGTAPWCWRASTSSRAARACATLSAVLPLTVLAWTLAHLLFFGDSRFLPIVFIVALLAARAVVVLYEAVWRPRPATGGVRGRLNTEPHPGSHPGPSHQAA